MDCSRIAEIYPYAYEDFCYRVGGSPARECSDDITKARLINYLAKVGVTVEIKEKKSGDFYYLIHKGSKVVTTNYRDQSSEESAWEVAIEDCFKILDAYIVKRVAHGEKRHIYEQIKKLNRKRRK